MVSRPFFELPPAFLCAMMKAPEKIERMVYEEISVIRIVVIFCRWPCFF
jgi:hypothetical protein